jgi:hypothetical protein
MSFPSRTDTEALTNSAPSRVENSVLDSSPHTTPQKEVQHNPLAWSTHHQEHAQPSAAPTTPEVKDKISILNDPRRMAQVKDFSACISGIMGTFSSSAPVSHSCLLPTKKHCLHSLTLTFVSHV